MTREALDELKREIPLLDYLQAYDWRPQRQLSRGRWIGLCPLHPDRHPSFVVDRSKGLFYCYGCGRGGDVIRFAEIYHEVRFPQAVTLLRQWRGLAPLLQDAADFYHLQLHRHCAAVAYLHQRGIHSPEVIDHMRIGYAPGACLRGWLMELGHPLATLSQSGLVTSAGYDTYMRRIVFPLEGNLYGRSISASAPLTDFCLAVKAACIAGTKSGIVRKSSLSRGYSITPCCGRPIFTTSPAAWERISTGTSGSSCRTAIEPSISPLMRTRMGVVNRQRKAWQPNCARKG